MTLRLKILLAMLFGVLSIACSSSNNKAGAGEEVTFDDGYKVNESNEIVIDDSAFADKGVSISKTKESSEQGTRIATDQSQITTQNDGHGNITETRKFPSSARIRMLMIRSTPDGTKQVFVYGQDAMVKELPPELHAKALTASADEIADSVKMYGGKIIKLRPFAQSTPLRPIQSSQFPVRNRTAQIVRQETEEVAAPLGN
jgi:hypothetical protein